MVNKAQITAVEQLVKLVKGCEGANARFTASATQGVTRALSEGKSFEEITKGMKAPLFDVNIEGIAGGIKGDAFIKDGENVVAQVRGQIQLPKENAEDWMTMLGDFIKGIKGKKTTTIPEFKPTEIKPAELQIDKLKSAAVKTEEAAKKASEIFKADLEKYGVAIREDGLVVTKEAGSLHDATVLKATLKEGVAESATSTEKNLDQVKQWEKALEYLEKHT